MSESPDEFIGDLGPDWLAGYGVSGALDDQADSQVMLWRNNPPPNPERFEHTFYGHQTKDGFPQAKLTAETCCDTCGKRFQQGEAIDIELAIPPAQATFRHQDCEPIRRINPSARGIGFGIKPIPLPAANPTGDQQ